MKKIILPAAGLLAGLLGGTAWTVVTFEPPAEVVADSAAADSLAEVADHGAEHGDDSARPPATGEARAAHEDAPDDDHGSAAASVEHGQPVQAAVTPVARTEPAPPPAEPAEAEESTDDAQGAAQLAKIFAAMQPKDAARVLGQLTDPEIRQILTRMGTRQAAAVLSSMSPERAAVLSRGVLGTEEAPE